MPPASRTASSIFLRLRRPLSSMMTQVPGRMSALRKVSVRAGIAGVTVHAGVVETPGERPAFDDELDLEAGQQDLVEHPDDQFVLADG